MTFAELVLLLVLIAGVFAIAGWVARLVGWARGRKPAPVTLQGEAERERRLEQALREVIEHEGHTAVNHCMTMMITTARTALNESEPATAPTPKGAVQGQGSAEP